MSKFSELVASATSVDELFRDDYAVRYLHGLIPLHKRIKTILTERIYVKSIVRKRLFLFLSLAEKVVETPASLDEIMKYKRMILHPSLIGNLINQHRQRLLYYLELVELIFDDLPEPVEKTIMLGDDLSNSEGEDLVPSLRSNPACSCCRSQTAFMCECGAASFCGPYCYIFSSHKCTKNKNE